jgi:glutamyl-Q tRNA(Asp) synthetase
LNVPTYLHHLLLTNAAGERLSKRDGAVAIQALRQAGRSAAEVRALAGFPDRSRGEDH